LEITAYKRMESTINVTALDNEGFIADIEGSREM